MSYKGIYYPESRWGGFTDVDGTIAFYNRVNTLIDRDSIVLDIGCGRGCCDDDPIPIRRNLRILKGKSKKVIGIDVDKAAKTNPYIDEFHLIEEDRWPVADSTADLCLCDSVLEHVQNPDFFFSECVRVLKPGGYFCARTPNIISYFGLAVKIIPNRLHNSFLGKVQNNRKTEDIFPTLYRCNTGRKLRKILRNHGFNFCVYGYEAEPAYFCFSKILYFLVKLHQQFAPKSLKSTLFVFAQKTD